ncbi:MAG: nicotinate dehydrogenase subunit B [Paracoccaceae bacterium]|jgi:nicotinate dehydrogenase subunit B
MADELAEDPIAFHLRHLEDPRARAVIEGVAAQAAEAMARPLPDDADWGIGFARYKNTAAWCAIPARI